MIVGEQIWRSRQSFSSNLEEASELMGASRWRILRKITFPLVIPALLSGFTMTFSKVMGTFGGPNVLGVPVRYYTISTMIRSSIGIGEYGDGFVLAITLILFATITIYINQKVVGTRRSYETIGGRGFVARQVKLRNWRWVLTALVLVSVAKHIPYSARSEVSAMLQVGQELEKAGQVAGANLWRRFSRIIFPLTSPGFVSGFLLTLSPPCGNYL